MALKKFKPNTPSTRQLVIVDRSGLHKGKPVKTLTQGLTKKAGRNNDGRITARRRAVGTSGFIVLLISSGVDLMCRRLSSGSNTIPIAPLSSR